MPHPVTKLRLDDLRERASELKIEKVTKPDLGKLGIPLLAHNIEKLRKELQVISSVSDDASEQQLEDAISAYKDYFDVLYDIASVDGLGFTNRREEFGTRLMSGWNAVRGVWPPFAANAFANSGLLDDPDSAHLKIVKAAQDGEEAIRAVISELLKHAKEEATLIENRARKTAQKVSIKEAQEQFDHASRTLRHKALACGAITIVTFTSFIGFAMYVYRNPPKFTIAVAGSTASLTQGIYETAIRITILTAIGALTTFFLKMLRAYLHMMEFNDHRRRIANSMSAFVESAQSPEQRDLIFGRLVEAIVIFGDSGILNKDAEGISVPSVVIDAVTKNLSTKA